MLFGNLFLFVCVGEGRESKQADSNYPGTTVCKCCFSRPVCVGGVSPERLMLSGGAEVVPEPLDDGFLVALSPGDVGSDVVQGVLPAGSTRSGVRVLGVERLHLQSAPQTFKQESEKAGDVKAHGCSNQVIRQLVGSLPKIQRG